MKNSDTVFILARKNLGQNGSARFCMSEAMRFKDDGKIDFAIIQAMRSLAYSVGILHLDYKKAFNVSGISGECRLVSMSDAR